MTLKTRRVTNTITRHHRESSALRAGSLQKTERVSEIFSLSFFLTQYTLVLTPATTPSNRQEIDHNFDRRSYVLAQPLSLTRPAPLHKFPVTVMDGRLIRSQGSPATRQRDKHLRVVVVVMVWYLACQHLQGASIMDNTCHVTSTTRTWSMVDPKEYISLSGVGATSTGSSSSSSSTANSSGAAQRTLPRMLDVKYPLLVASTKIRESPKSDRQAFPLSLMSTFDYEKEVSQRT